MAHSPSAVAIIPESDPGITAILPIGPSNSDLAMTLPFETSDVSQELRAAIIKPTKNRWAWFSRAEDLDEERGTQLGTLGYFPWEIRQNIFKEYFDGNFRKKIIRPDGCVRPPLLEDDDPPGVWQLTGYPGDRRLWMIRMASANLKLEVEYAFLTMMHFDFRSMEAMIYFLGCLTTYEQSLLRSVSVPLNLRSGIKPEIESWMDGCAILPSGLTCIKFRFCHKSWRWPKDGIDLTKIYPSLAESLELLIKKIKRCWAPRADISLDYGSDTHRCRVRNKFTVEMLNSAFRASEARGQDWLAWQFRCWHGIRTT